MAGEKTYESHPVDQERETNMPINLNYHRSILRLAVLALAILLGMGTYVAMAQKKPDESIIVDPYNTKRKAQPTPSRAEVKYYTITLTEGVFVHVPDGMKFLEDPVGVLRRNLITTLSADVHWKKLAAALHKLAKPQTPPRSTPLLHKVLVDNRVVQLQIPDGWIPVAGDWNGDGTSTGAEFLKSPVATLRAHGIYVAAADANSWQEVADALKALRRAYAGRDTHVQDISITKAQDINTGEVTPRNRIESRQVVGSCNTTQGCKALKSVCETLPKHDFTTNKEGSVGVCADATRNSDTAAWFLRNSNTAGNSNEGRDIVGIDVRPGNNQAQGNRQYSEVVILKRVDVSTPSLNCEGVAMCRKVQSICATLGGTYQRRNDVSGSCRH